MTDPTVSSVQTALGASPHFEWRPGMQTVTDQGIRGIVSHIRDSGWYEVTYRFQPGEMGSKDGHHRAFYAPDAALNYPDIGHGGTQGEMLALVRKAWGPGHRIEIIIREDGSATVEIRDPAEGLHEFDGDTLGLALAAALLAAPVQPTHANCSVTTAGIEMSK